MYPDAGAARLRVGSSSTAPTRKHNAPSDVAALTMVTSATLPLDGTTYAATAAAPKATQPQRFTVAVVPSSVPGGRRSRPWATAT